MRGLIIVPEWKCCPDTYIVVVYGSVHTYRLCVHRVWDNKSEALSSSQSGAVAAVPSIGRIGSLIAVKGARTDAEKSSTRWPAGQTMELPVHLLGCRKFVTRKGQEDRPRFTMDWGRVLQGMIAVSAGRKSLTAHSGSLGPTVARSMLLFMVLVLEMHKVNRARLSARMDMRFFLGSLPLRQSPKMTKAGRKATGFKSVHGSRSRPWTGSESRSQPQPAMRPGRGWREVHRPCAAWSAVITVLFV